MKAAPWKLLAAIVAALGLLATSSSHAGSIISGVSKVEGNATAIGVVDAGLAESVEAYVDRTHALVNIPAGLLGSDLIQVSNDDKSSDPYELEVTLGSLGLLYVGLDDRLSGDDNTTPATPFAWMSDNAFTGLPNGFYDTHANIDIDEGADGSINQTFSLWVALAPPGTYSLGTQNFGGNNYIAFGSNYLVVPEPSSFAMAGLGLAGLACVLRRRRA